MAQPPQQYIKPWTSAGSSSGSPSYLDQQPYMTNALFYPPGPAVPGTGAGGDMYLPRISTVPQQQPYPGAYGPMMAAAAASMNAGQMYQPYYQPPFYQSHRTSVSRRQPQ